MVQTPENCAGSTVAVRLNVVDAPVMQVLRGAAGAVPAGMDVPVIMQRRCSLVQWKCSDSVHRLIWWTSQFATETGTLSASWVR